MLRELVMPRIDVAPLTSRGFYEARPGDVIPRSDLFVVDVRREEDLLGDLGHIHQVRHLPLGRIDALDVPLETPIVVVCGNGFESRKAAVTLVERGFSEVYLLVGGMLRWNAEERPVARKATWRPL